MAGDRQLVRNAVAAYFGGPEVTTQDGGVWYQGGSIPELGTAFPYLVKKGAPDSFYTAGQVDGAGWGAVLTVGLATVRNYRDSYAGKTSGIRERHYAVSCSIDVISYEPHLEVAEAGLDDLLNALDALIYADRTLGTTGNENVQIVQAGEGGKGGGITHGRWQWQTEPDRGRGRGGIDYSFDAMTLVVA